MNEAKTATVDSEGVEKGVTLRVWWALSSLDQIPGVNRKK